MGKETIFLKLDKPDPDEFYDIGVYNKNLDKIDAELERQNTYIKELERKLTGNIIYGFHINGEESDPDKMVSYIADAVGMTPAYMDFEKDTFNYGSWKDAFFMPRPCMLKYDGTVDYYLDENDYTKRADGGESDVENVSYAGNAMMEWGKDGRLIWIKVVPDQNPISGSVYIANYQADDDFHAWSFENASGTLSEHFYTSIYNNGLDLTDRSRSLSKTRGGEYNGGACCTVNEAIEKIDKNNISDKKIWHPDMLSDIMLISFLFLLISKTTNSCKAFGKYSSTSTGFGSDAIGICNDKGLFYGTKESDNIKTFGMEQFSSERSYVGYVLDHGRQKIKMTCCHNGYEIENKDYIDINIPLEKTPLMSSITQMEFNEYGMFVKKASKETIYDKYYCAVMNNDVDKIARAMIPTAKEYGLIFSVFLSPGESDYANMPNITCKPY